jgi:hypothetical protein
MPALPAGTRKLAFGTPSASAESLSSCSPELRMGSLWHVLRWNLYVPISSVYLSGMEPVPGSIGWSGSEGAAGGRKMLE